MKHLSIGLLLVAFIAAPLAAQPAAAPAGDPAPKTVKDQASYGIGFNIGNSLKQDELDVNAAMIARGLINALSGTKPILDRPDCEGSASPEATTTGDATHQQATPKATSPIREEGIVVAGPAVQGAITEKGSARFARKPTRAPQHYHGTLINGKVFDSSVERGEPAEFPVNRVIPGWTEALQLMKVGDKWQLFIPSKLAYGKRGSPGGIAPTPH